MEFHRPVSDPPPPHARVMPARLYEARAIRVLRHDTLLVEIDLGFGCLVQRKVRIEGVDGRPPPGDMGDRALHCMVSLLGGKRLVVQVSEFPFEGAALSRVYLDENVYGNPPGMADIGGLDERMLDVGEFFQHLGRYKFEVDIVRSATNAKQKGRSDVRWTPVRRDTVSTTRA